MSSPAREAPRPRLLEVDLTALEDGAHDAVRRGAFTSPDPLLQRVGGWTGPAAALALAVARERGAGDLPFLVAVGECVRRGLPTAARATVLARSPLTGRPSEGQVGSDLARRLASVTDVLAIAGRTSLPGAVLVLGGDGAVELSAHPELVGLAPEAVHGRLVRSLGEGAFLRIGPAGERGIAYANLASGHGPQSFVGRGLGAALGVRGLKALAVTAPPVGDGAVGDGLKNAQRRALARALTSSPRLLARSAGGTLELASAFGVRGDLRAHGYRDPLDRRVGERLSDAAREARVERRGCKGCPTPCGWVFETGSGARRGARFSAVYALGANLGLEEFDDALGLLALCDDLGIDAVEAGAVLALVARARERGRLPGEPLGETLGETLWGRRDALEALLRGLVSGEGEEEHSPLPLGLGAATLARRLALEGEVPLAGGEAARPESSLAAVLGACVGARGAEPLRTFPFLVGDGADRERIAALVAPLALPPGAEDPRSGAGKGRLVWWHENLVTALDAAGFCAFSAAGLLADGACDLDELAGWVAPETLGDLPGGGDLSPGRRLLAMGATLVGLFRELAGSPPVATPGWARGNLELPGMAPEYRAFRGLQPGGAPTAAAREALGTARILELAGSGIPSPPAPPASPAPAPTAPGAVVLRSSGTLAERLGPRARLELRLPATVRAVLERAAEHWPAAADHLFSNGRPLPAVYRDGVRVGSEEAVTDGDGLDLVLAVSGG